jgi:hypothetical protein
MPEARFPGRLVVRSLEEFGRVRLSASFFMRDFLLSQAPNRRAEVNSVPGRSN